MVNPKIRQSLRVGGFPSKTGMVIVVARQILPERRAYDDPKIAEGEPCSAHGSVIAKSPGSIIDLT
jgi:hypothetical protein